MVSMTVPQMRRFECTVSGTVRHLSPAMAEILALLLVSHPSRHVAKHEIIDHVWPDDPPLTVDKIVPIYVYRLRRLGINIEHRPAVHRRDNAHYFDVYGGYRIPKGERQ